RHRSLHSFPTRRSSDLAQAILGLLPHRGRILLQGQDAAELTPRQRLARMAHIAEDRQHEALVLPLSVEDNLALKAYASPPFATRSEEHTSELQSLRHLV